MCIGCLHAFCIVILTHQTPSHAFITEREIERERQREDKMRFGFVLKVLLLLICFLFSLVFLRNQNNTQQHKWWTVANHLAMLVKHICVHVQIYTSTYRKYTQSEYNNINIIKMLISIVYFLFHNVQKCRYTSYYV